MKTKAMSKMTCSEALELLSDTFPTGSDKWRIVGKCASLARMVESGTIKTKEDLQWRKKVV